VFKHSATSLVISARCSSLNHPKVSFRKWMPLGRDSNRRAIGLIPPLWRSSRDPVNGGRFESWATVGSLSSDTSASTVTVRSSRRGNEMMRSKNFEEGPKMKTTRIDLRAGENPWNGVKVTVCQWPSISKLLIQKCTTREKPVIQPPGSPSVAVTAWAQPTIRISV